MSKDAALKSAPKVLDVLNVLLGHFAHGLTLTDLARATGHPMPTVSRYVAALEVKGFAERVPETGRIRPSVRLAQHAIAILNDLDRAQRRLDELRARIATPVQ
ncbi:MAG: helix-turn-helix domain-containing protein [Pseudomonadota bacterium]